jgi:hypothetical protein
MALERPSQIKQKEKHAGGKSLLQNIVEKFLTNTGFLNFSGIDQE